MNIFQKIQKLPLVSRKIIFFAIIGSISVLLFYLCIKDFYYKLQIFKQRDNKTKILTPFSEIKQELSKTKKEIEEKIKD